jgi:O-antigen/teichoic acid export membrane protein
VLLTTFALNFGFGIVGAVFLLILGGFLLQHVISIPASLRPEVARSFPWIAVLFPMALLSGVGVGALESRERFLLANVLQVVGMSLTQIAPAVVAATVSPSLTVVVPTAVVAQASSMVVGLAIVYRLEGPFSVRAFDRREARALIGYGSWISVSNIISPLLVSFDQFLIGSIMGVASVAHYAVPMQLVVRSQIFPAALARTFFPRMSGLSTGEARLLGARALSSLGYGYAAVCAVAIILSPAFFRYWIGGDFALLAAPVAQILFLGAWINGLAFVVFTLIQSQGRPDITGKLHMIEIVPFLLILWALTSTLGINGAAIAWSVRCTADALALFWVSGIPKRDVLSALRPGALLVASEVATKFVGSALGLALPASVLVGLIGIGFAYAWSDDWRQLIDVQLTARVRRFSGTLIRRARPSGSP